MNTLKSQSQALVSPHDALMRRDSLEATLTRRLPDWLAHLIGFFLTWLTGLAPSATKGNPVILGSEARSFAVTAFSLLLGSTVILCDAFWPVMVIGLVALLHGMRSFSSVVGHHMTHGAKVLPVTQATRRLVYDVISAAFLWTRFDAYRKEHQQHHAYAAGPNDADQQFISYLAARFDGLLPFLRTLLDPLFHYRFVKARLAAVFMAGPVWRRIFGLISMLVWWTLAPAAWFVIVIVLFQSATLLQWSTEHLWGRRPMGQSAAETATAVTYGRLLLPVSGFWWKLPAYTLFRLTLLSGDLPNHDLHHLGKGPWVDAAYTRTRLILEGQIVLRQTGGLRSMFELAFDSAKGGPEARPPREMEGERMLGM